MQLRILGFSKPVHQLGKKRNDLDEFLSTNHEYRLLFELSRRHLRYVRRGPLFLSSKVRNQKQKQRAANYRMLGTAIECRRLPAEKKRQTPR